jgi:cytochrome P450
MTSAFPLAELTLNELSWQDRDDRLARLFEWPEPVYRHSSGLLVSWRYDDVKQILEADAAEISNSNSLDPLVGYPRIMATPGAIPPFLRHLVPLPAKATANLTDTGLHKRVWDAMAGPTGHFTIAAGERAEWETAIRRHFHAELDRFQADGVLDVTGLSIAVAARVTGSAVGLPAADWPRVAVWSGAQSGLLGRQLRGRELATAVEGLGQLFTVSANAVRNGAGEQTFAARLNESQVSRRVAVSAMANSLAAGVHTIAGTIQQGVQRLLGDPERVWWSALGDPDGSRKVAARILQLDPGLVAWKRRITKPVTLSSGARLEPGPVLALFAGANRDPEAFENPFDLESRGKLPLTFGFGKHVCPGKQLANVAIESFLRELHTVAPEPEPELVAAQRAARSRDLLFSGADVSVLV